MAKIPLELAILLDRRSHCDTTVSLHDHLHAVRDGRLEAIWRIEGRGARECDVVREARPGRFVVQAPQRVEVLLDEVPSVCNRRHPGLKTASATPRARSVDAASGAEYGAAADCRATLRLIHRMAEGPAQPGWRLRVSSAS